MSRQAAQSPNAPQEANLRIRALAQGLSRLDALRRTNLPHPFARTSHLPRDFHISFRPIHVIEMKSSDCHCRTPYDMIPSAANLGGSWQPVGMVSGFRLDRAYNRPRDAAAAPIFFTRPIRFSEVAFICNRRGRAAPESAASFRRRRHRHHQRGGARCADGRADERGGGRA